MIIIEDRYLGSYSGGKWIALNLHYSAVPKEIGSDDSTESDFWSEWDYSYTGLGDTPDEAMHDLIRKNKDG